LPIWTNDPARATRPINARSETVAARSLALAGLWEWFKWPSGEVTRTFCILTTTSNRDVDIVHDRMPVVLEPADWPVWLGEAAGDPASLLRPVGEGVLRLWPISTVVSTVRHNGPDLLTPLRAAAVQRPTAAPPARTLPDL
jgi:putative SOS response-associated peptidase YedK